jgi:holo-[acyl-carrier protein] synthase
VILGLGNDIIDIRRIEKALDRYGERFLARVFTATERAKSDARAGRAASYAKRFAAKEACAKALGTGFRKGVFWRDMGVVNLRSGRPTMVLTGGAAEQLRRITPRGLEPQVDVSLTDDFPQAQAIVVISAEPASGGPVPEADSTRR